MENLWGTIFGQRNPVWLEQSCYTLDEMQALLWRQALERRELEAKLGMRALQAQAEAYAAARFDYEKLADEWRIENAPDLWRRIDEARRKHGLKAL